MVQKFQIGVCKVDIERNEYLNKLINRKKNGLIKIVTGVRRCGKSYLLFKLFYQHLILENIAEDHIIDIQLDDFKNRKLLNPVQIWCLHSGTALLAVRNMSSITAESRAFRSEYFFTSLKNKAAIFGSRMWQNVNEVILSKTGAE